MPPRRPANRLVDRGKRYRSPFALARLITGTRWSEPRFFDLKP